MDKTYRIKLGVGDKMPQHTNIVVCQGDSGIKFEIEATGIDLTGIQARLIFKKNNCESVETELLTATNNIYTYALQGNEISVPGNVVADVKFFEGAKRISSSKFLFYVDQDTLNDTPINSGAYSARLDVVINQALEVISQTESAAINEPLRVEAEAQRVAEFNNMIENGYILPQQPVATFSAIATTYPTPAKSWTVKTLDDGKIYRYNGTEWKWIDTVTASSYDAFLSQVAKLNSDLNDKAPQEQANNIQSQVNALVVGSGTSSAEVVQDRVDYNGYIFPTIKAKSDAIQKLIKDGSQQAVFSDWEVGSLDGTTGVADTGTTNRIRTSGYHDFTIGEKLKITPVSGYKFGLFAYDSSYTKAKVIVWVTVASEYIVVYPHYKFIVAKTDDSVASINFADSILFTVTDGSINDGNNFNIGSVGGNQLKHKSISKDKCDFILSQTINFQDASKCTENYLLDYQGLPILKASSNAGVTDFMPVDAGQTYTYKRVNNGTVYEGIMNGYCLYDEHKKFLSFVTTTLLPSLSVVKKGYIRIFYNSAYLYTYFANECVFCLLSAWDGKYYPYTDNAYLSDTIKIKKSNLTNTTDNMAICRWGDSLTMQADINNLATVTGLPCRRCGGGSESSYGLASRMGAMPIYVEPFTIPADTSEVTITLKNIFGTGSSLMVLNDGNCNPVTINGVEGTITYVNSETRKFKRTVSGNAISVTRPVPLITYGQRNFLNDIAVIWIGTNDGITSSNYSGLVDRINTMIDSLKAQEKEYIVLGLHKVGTQSQLTAINQGLQLAFGKHFLDIYTYMLTYGLADAGITPTAQDEIDIANGLIPSSLRADSTHFNTIGYMIIDNLIAKKLRELGYIS